MIALNIIFMLNSAIVTLLFSTISDVDAKLENETNLVKEIVQRYRMQVINERYYPIFFCNIKIIGGMATH